MSKKYDILKDKYEKAKKSATIWHDKMLEKEEEISFLKDEIDALKDEIDTLKDEINSPELDEENKKELAFLKAENKSLKKQLKEMDEKYKDKIFLLERDKILSDGKIQQLEEVKKDLQERYKELRQDMREINKKN
jgi:chromosome segregation ATPase